MNKLISIIVFAIFAATVNAQPSLTLSTSYREKGIAFGKVFDEKGAQVLGAEAVWKSFRLAGALENRASIGRSELYRATVVGGYTFFSTLADVEIGNEYVVFNSPNKYDVAGGHFRPFVGAAKGPFKLTAQMDLESKLSSIEGRAAKNFKLLFLTVTPGVFVGYTDCNDWLPKSRTKLKFNEAFYGGEVRFSYRMVNASVLSLHNGANGTTTNAFTIGLSHKL